MTEHRACGGDAVCNGGGELKVVDTMTCLIVKKENLNNKRFSRLQGVILKVLAAGHPHGYKKHNLCRIAAHAYGNGSIITQGDKELVMLEKERGKGNARLDDLIDKMKRTPRHERDLILRIGMEASRDGSVWHEWVNPKFSVSFSRSIRNLLGQGYVSYLRTMTGDWALFINEKGLEFISQRKVKVDSRGWDMYISHLKANKEGK